MKFYDRQMESESLIQIETQSIENACFTVVVGRRRVGKTCLLLLQRKTDTLQNELAKYKVTLKGYSLDDM